MKRVFAILIFVLLQLAAIAVLTLWIVWYSQGPNFETSVLWLLQGIFLMLPIIFGATFIFIYLFKMNYLDELRTSFISGISHELLTPLASLKLYLETMTIRDLNRIKTREFHGLMLDETERLSSLISKILTVSRIEKREMLFYYKRSDVRGLIKNFIAANNVLVENIDLNLKLDSNCFCNIDCESFNIVLKNMFDNAIKYSGKKIKINIILTKNRGKLLLIFKDNGPGMEKKNLKKIFKMFYQSNAKSKGTGLGLYIIRNMIKAHKGKVWAESGPSKGLTIKILLPALG